LSVGEPRTPTQEDVLGWCARALPASEPSSAAPLSGGLLNHVFRVQTGAGSVVLKHTPGYVAAAPEVALSDGRAGFERAALEEVASRGTQAARAPRLLGWLDTPRVLVTEDLGPLPHLGEVLGDTPRARALGARLGAFVSALHRDTAGHAALAARFDNAPVQEVRLASQYAAVSGWLEEAGVADAAALGASAAAVGEDLTGPGACLIMGDLWPPSVLCDGVGVRVIDWEFAHYGRPCQDVAHLGAHLWMAHAGDAGGGEGARAAWEGFSAAYVFGAPGAAWSGGELGACAVHFGAEVLTRTVGAFAGSVAVAPGAERAVGRAVGALRSGEDPWFVSYAGLG
jgi:Ser/Thr protein kinase RdoA (MazF antagonist)